MIDLIFSGLLLLKTSSIVFQTKGPSLCARNLNEKKAFSPATVFLEK